jgi:DNA-binding NtrC family response regulator
MSGAALSRPLIVVADDDPQLLKVVQLRLEQRNFRVATAATKRELYEVLEREEPALVVLDLFFGPVDGLDLLQELRSSRPNLNIVMFSAHGSIDGAVSAIKFGAFDFLTKPLDFDRLASIIQHARERSALRTRVEHLEREVAAQVASRPLLGVSPAMTQLRAIIADVAGTDATVLIFGASGTGKELIARSLHEQSRRAKGAFVPFNMAALPRDLVESTLFGHEKGAFTGADRFQIGCCEAADGGTLFLDEIGEMSIDLQAKLLRFLQERAVQRIGAVQAKPVDVRVVAATHRDLFQQVRDGKFREDLYYRLHVVPLRSPALRDRPEDVPVLIDHFLSRTCERYRREGVRFTSAAIGALQRYSWPGNVRELENLVEQVVILTRSSNVDVEDLPEQVRVPSARDAEKLAAPSPEAPTSVKTIDDMERRAIVNALRATKGNVREAAQQLGIGQATVYRRLKRFGIVLEDLGRSPDSASDNATP